MTVSFKIPATDHYLISKIVDRAIALGLQDKATRIDLEMDITAVHANGSELRLKDLLEADKFSFAHDIMGIHASIDRQTGGFTNFFLPRFRALKRGGSANV